MNKKVLNENQLRNEIIKHLLENNIVNSRKQAEKMLDEGFFDKLKAGLSNAWSKTKHGLSKLGTITAGGKYFGQTKAKLAAQSQMDAEMAKKGNKSIRDLDKTLKAQFPGFPNVENKEQFIAGVQAIGQVYESVVAASKLKPGTKGYLSPKRANNIIKSLRMYAQKLIDYDLASVYRMFNENDEKYYQENQYLLFEAAAQAGPLTGSKETETEKVYKSNKAPLTLLAVGSALGAFSWLANTDWFKNLFATKSTVPVTKWMTQDTQKVLGSVKPGDGLTQTLNGTVYSKLSAASPPEDFVKALAKLGGGSAEKGAELLTQKGGFLPQAGAKEALMDIIKDPHGKGDTLGQIFKGKLAGTGKEIGDLLVTKPGSVIVGVVKAAVPKIALMTTVKIGAGYAAAKGLGGVLGPIGIGLVAAGALVKGLRMKGLKSSRMKTLKDLLTSMNDVAVPKVEKPAEEKTAKKQNNKKAKTEPTAQAAAQPAAAQPAAQPAAAQPAAAQPAAQPAAKVTKKRTKKTKSEPEAETPAQTTPATVQSAKPSGGTDYKRNKIGFNRELSEAFKLLVKALNKKRIL